MLATRSIVTPMVMHALYDWNVVFSNPDPDQTNQVAHFDPIWQTIQDSFWFVAMDLFLGFSLLGLMALRRYKKLPRFAQPLFLKLKLVRAD
jgi:hypothetical protein